MVLNVQNLPNSTLIFFNFIFPWWYVTSMTTQKVFIWVIVIDFKKVTHHFHSEIFKHSNDHATLNFIYKHASSPPQICCCLRFERWSIIFISKHGMTLSWEWITHGLNPHGISEKKQNRSASLLPAFTPEWGQVIKCSARHVTVGRCPDLLNNFPWPLVGFFQFLAADAAVISELFLLLL